MNDEDRMKLIGIKAVADHHLAALDDLAKMAASIVGEELDSYGYGDSSDFVYGNYKVEEFIRRHEPND